MLSELAIAQTGAQSSIKPMQGNPQGILKTVLGGDTGTVTSVVTSDAAPVSLAAANTSRHRAVRLQQEHPGAEREAGHRHHVQRG